MLEAHFASKPTWLTLPNPFIDAIDTSEIITGHVSGRSTDITKIIIGTQSAILLTGAPYIGKSTLVRYLQRPSTAEWSWRNELQTMLDQLNLHDLHFVLVDLTPFETIKSSDDLLNFFIKQCNAALRPFIPPGREDPSDDLKDLYRLVRSISRETADARYFLMFDTIERLDLPGMKLFELFDLNSVAQTPQERSIALLDHCGAIHTLVDLIDEFYNFGAIFSIESLPRPKMGDQFTHVSADLARFTPMTLQTFTWKDTLKFLQQKPENFGSKWAEMFQTLGGTYIFSDAEQTWLRTHAGTHPYLLQQFCSHTFHFKQEYANIHGCWADLQPDSERQLIEWMNERLSMFLGRIWKRLQEAVEKSSHGARNKFYEFIRVLAEHSAEEEIDTNTWLNLDIELRYILSSEGIVRYDPFQVVHYPGSTLCQYLSQMWQENSPPAVRGFWLTLTLPGSQPERFSLSELEYHLLKTLLQHPKRCTEDELIKSAWSKPIERSTFTQRIHHLRKKLRDKCGGVEIIENHYGGQYSLNYPEWFQLE